MEKNKQTGLFKAQNNAGQNPDDSVDRILTRNFDFCAQKNAKAILAAYNKPPIYVKANSVEEAQDFATANFGYCFCDYKGMSLEIANTINSSIVEGINLCPKIIASINFIGKKSVWIKKQFKDITEFFKMNDPNPYNDYSQLVNILIKLRIKDNVKNSLMFSPIAKTTDPELAIINCFDGIVIPDKYIDTSILTDKLSGGEKSGFYPKGCASVKYAVDHEVGHHLDKALNILSSKPLTKLLQELKTNTQTFIANMIKDINKAMTFEDVGREISLYALRIGADGKLNELVPECYAAYKNSPTKPTITQLIYDIILSQARQDTESGQINRQ